MSDWRLTGFQNLLSIKPAALPAGGATTSTELDLSALLSGAGAAAAQAPQIFGCDCNNGPKSGLSQAEMEAAWRENGAL